MPTVSRKPPQLLLSAQRPLIVCGDQVAQSGAVSALVALAEFLGAGVYSEILPARVNFPNQHPHYRDRLPHDQRADPPVRG